MKVNPSISLRFNGQCEAAFQFYQQCLGARPGMALTWGASPMAQDAPPEWSGKILYAALTLGDTEIVGGDVLPEHYQAPRGFAIMLDMSDPPNAERIFNSLAENGKVGMPLQPTFWAARYGSVTDRFGIPWEINCGNPA